MAGSQTALGAILKYAPIAGDFLETKLGNEEAKALEDEAWKAFYAIEEDSRLGDFLGSKFKAFEKVIQGKFPDITNAEILAINKAIAGEFNKDKATLIAKMPEVAAPVINAGRYYNRRFYSRSIQSCGCSSR